MKPQTKLLAISLIERDMLLQPRAELHRDWIEDYATDMTNGANMPPIIVYRDDEGRHWLADGFHRTYAAESAGLTEILTEIRKGTRRDALLHSLSANAEHGHRRTNEDKRRAIDIALNDADWSRWSDSEIARRCGVASITVGRRRQELSLTMSKIADARLVTRNGTTYPMDTSRIGTITEAPHLPLLNPQKPELPYDWDAARIRSEAMEAIRTLAKQPSASEVIAAWAKSMSYGEPVETLERAISWLTEFAELYRAAEPVRWAKVLRSKGEKVDVAK